MRRLRKGKVRTPGRRRLVFLSHGSRDRWVALQLEAHIQRAGADVFLDASCIQAGGDIDEALRQPLATMNEIVVLLTPWSMERPYVWSELGVAWHRRVPIMGLLYGVSVEDIQKRPEVPHYLKGTNLKDLNDVEVYLTGLSRRCGPELTP